ncbi:MAG: filamentous hemagglutinin N-terminal domain-containing protein [Cyanobacteria bacterium J06581_3]
MRTTLVNYIARICRVGLAAAVITLCGWEGAISQPIAPDSTLGAETSVLDDGTVNGNPARLIEGGATRGSNLFHSFSEFNIGAGESVYFKNPMGIDNILSRITGASLSEINGRLGVLGSANLFLLNPNGIVFGADAQLDISGSFNASTADSLLFTDNSAFSVATQDTALLSVSVPLGIQLNTTASQDIVNLGNLQTGQDLALSGNNILSEGSLTAAGLVSLQALEEISAVGTIISGVFDPSDNSVIQGGNRRNSISISTLSGNITVGNIDTSASMSEDATDGDAGNGGNIVISSNSGNITTGTLNANSFVQSAFGGAGTGGDIEISAAAGSIETSDISNTSLTQFGIASGGGDVTISASGSITTGSVRASSFAEQGGEAGNGGAINISSIFGDIVTEEVRAVSRASEGVPGEGGDIRISSIEGTITANGVVESSSSSFFLQPKSGGDISISSVDGDIILNNNVNSFVLSSFSFPPLDDEAAQAQDGGDISISSSFGNILIDGNINSFATSDFASSGRAGNISLIARNGSVLGQGTQVNAFSSAAPPENIFGEEVTSGAGGTVTIAAQVIANLNLFTLSSAGESGSINIQGRDDGLEINNVRLTTTGRVQGVPFLPAENPLTFETVARTSQSGDTRITSEGDIRFNNVEIQSDSNGDSPAGNIIVFSRGQVIFDNSQINSSANDSGAAGNIQIESARLNLGEGDRIFATTSAAGVGGSITINATDAVFLGEGVQNAAPVISVGASGSGRPGSIVINTPKFVLSETATITAASTETATNPDRGGSITLSSNQMDLSGTVQILAETQGQAPGGLLTLQPYQADPAQAQLQAIASDSNAESSSGFALTLEPNSLISASTTSSGNGGGLRLLSPDYISVSGPGRLQVETSGTGQAGSITAAARTLTLAEGVTLSASTTGPGAAGDITFNITEQLTLDDSIVESRTGFGSTGRGGNINVINSAQTTLNNNGRFTLNSDGLGEGGNLTLTSDSLTLDNSNITAITRNSDGGNFTFNLSDYLLLRNGSLISTEAGIAGADGNGGNIAINVPNGFIVAIPDEDSDIRANAFAGDGGNVSVTALNLLGIAFRPGVSDTPASDITSSSEFGNSGTVTISELNTETLQPATELPVNTAPATVARGCRGQGAQTGSFVSTGRGGLPASPIDPLSADSIWQDLAPLDVAVTQSVPTDAKTTSSESTFRASADSLIVEAQGWARTRDGSVSLIAERSESAMRLSSANVC